MTTASSPPPPEAPHRSRATPAELREAVRRSSITFVLGAGVSIPYGIPPWSDLARRVWRRSFPGRALPWSDEAAEGPKQLFPIVFELARDALGERRFASVLRTCLYANATPVGAEPPADAKPPAGAPTTREVVAQVLAAEVGDPAGRRVLRVVTFNADNLLEAAVSRAWRAAGTPRREARARRRRTGVIGKPGRAVELIGRQSQQVDDAARGPIPVYHLHGFIPSDARAPYSRNYEHTLVFTDSQYWATTTSLLSLPNTVMGMALHDSTCLFVGLSMTDGNILRWLGLRALEFETELEQRTARRSEARRSVRHELEARLRRHFWIRPEADDPSGLLTEFLATRGVRSVAIADWTGPQFGKLVRSCFGAPGGG